MPKLAESTFPNQLDILMEEYYPSGHQSGLVAENFNVQINGNSLDAHYHHGTSSSNSWSQYRNYDPIIDKHNTNYVTEKSFVMGKNYRPNRFMEDHQNTVNFYSKGQPITETDFRAHLDCNNQATIPVSYDLARKIDSIEKKFQDLIDESKKEVEAAATAVDNLGYNFTQDVKTVFHDLSTRLKESHGHWLRELSLSTGSVAKDDMINNLTDMLTKEKDQRDLCEWKVSDMANTQEVINLKLASKFRDRKMKQLVFNMLRGIVAESFKERCEAASKKKAEEVCRHLQERYGKAQTELEQEIDKLRREQAKLVQEKADYEAAVQQGLMKGLCSLNMEALKVFKLKMDSPAPDATWPISSQHSSVATNGENEPPQITGADSESPLGLTPSLMVIMENTKDNPPRLLPTTTQSELEVFINRSAGQPRPANRTPKKSDVEHADGLHKKVKSLALPNYQVIKLLKKPTSAAGTKKKSHL